MRNGLILDLADCTEFRQAVQARAPRIVHGAAILLILLLAAALIWMVVTKANLVVRAPGRVRPVSGPDVTCDDVSDQISCEVAGRVVEVNVNEGDEIRKGDVLVRLDTQRVENQIAGLERTIQAEEEELQKLEHLEDLAAREFQAAKQKAEAELAEVEEELRLALERQAADVRLAQLEVAEAEDTEARVKKLAARDAASEQELFEAVTRVRQAKEKAHRAEVPIEQGKVETLRRALDLVGREWEVKRKDLEISRRTKQGKLEADRLELANLRLQRDQAVVRAPADGIVTTVEVQIGDIVQPGKVGITTARQRGLEFEVAVANADVAHLKPGLPVEIKLDAYDYQKYGVLAGTLRFVAPDSEVTEGPNGGQAALYKVKITLAHEALVRGELRGRVKLGMTGLAEIVTDKESILMLLAKKIRQSISLG